jgi:hypothetical protein
MKFQTSSSRLISSRARFMDLVVEVNKSDGEVNKSDGKVNKSDGKVNKSAREVHGPRRQG